VALSKEDVEKIAHLSRLKLEESRVTGYIEDLNDVIKFVERMQSVNTDNVEPFAHPHHAYQRLRADEITETDQRDKYQKLAPKVDNGLYLVPRVIE